MVIGQFEDPSVFLLKLIYMKRGKIPLLTLIVFIDK